MWTRAYSFSKIQSPGSLAFNTDANYIYILRKIHFIIFLVWLIFFSINLSNFIKDNYGALNEKYIIFKSVLLEEYLLGSWKRHVKKTLSNSWFMTCTAHTEPTSSWFFVHNMAYGILPMYIYYYSTIFIPTWLRLFWFLCNQYHQFIALFSYLLFDLSPILSII